MTSYLANLGKKLSDALGQASDLFGFHAWKLQSFQQQAAF